MAAPACLPADIKMPTWTRHHNDKLLAIGGYILTAVYPSSVPRVLKKLFRKAVTSQQLPLSFTAAAFFATHLS